MSTVRSHSSDILGRNAFKIFPKAEKRIVLHFLNNMMEMASRPELGLHGCQVQPASDLLASRTPYKWTSRRQKCGVRGSVQEPGSVLYRNVAKLCLRLRDVHGLTRILTASKSNIGTPCVCACSLLRHMLAGPSYADLLS